MNSIWIPWSLKFQHPSAPPDQPLVMHIQSAHTFRGHYFHFADPSNFFLVRLTIGCLGFVVWQPADAADKVLLVEPRDQTCGPAVSCMLLQDQSLLLETASRSFTHTLAVQNKSDHPLPFQAELRGQCLLQEGEKPRPQSWEGPPTELPDEKNFVLSLVKAVEAIKKEALDRRAKLASALLPSGPITRYAGSMPCPMSGCTGVVQFALSPGNDHLVAVCNVAGCLKVRE